MYTLGRITWSSLRPIPLLLPRPSDSTNALSGMILVDATQIGQVRSTFRKGEVGTSTPRRRNRRVRGSSPRSSADELPRSASPAAEDRIRPLDPLLRRQLLMMVIKSTWFIAGRTS
eukprot:IDg4481t1